MKLDQLYNVKEIIINFCANKLRPSTAETISWFGVLLLHASLVPSLLAVMNGLTDKLPPIDIVLFIWTALLLFFVRATILKDIINIITIGLGFIINAVLMALILFK
jgi:hypothetical protein